MNINSCRNKFDCLTAFTENEVDILMISDTKLGTLLPQTQICMSGFSKAYKFDRNYKGGGMLLHVKYCPTGKVQYLFRRRFLLVLTTFSFREKTER